MAKTYSTVQGDTWDLIAFDQYGHERYMKNLIEANYHLSDTLVFDSGVEVIIPDLPERSDSDLPFWHNSDSYEWAKEVL